MNSRRILRTSWPGLILFASAIVVVGAAFAGFVWATNPPRPDVGPSPAGKPGSWPYERVDHAFVIGRDGVTSTTTIEFPDRSAIARYYTGDIDAPQLLDLLGANWGFRPKGETYCARIASASNATVSITSTYYGSTKVTAVEAVEAFDQPLKFDLCFPDGAPPAGAKGSVAVTVVDYHLGTVSPAPDHDPPSPTDLTYRWDDVEPDAHLTIELRQSEFDFLRQLPTLSPYAFFGGGFGSALAALLSLIPLVVPAFLVFWAIRVAEQQSSSATVAPARSLARVVAVLAVAPFLPSFLYPFYGDSARLIGERAATILVNTPFNKVLGAADIGESATFAILAIAAWVFYRLSGLRVFRSIRPIFETVTLAALLQFGIYIVGGLILIGGSFLKRDPAIASRMAVWLTGSMILLIVLRGVWHANSALAPDWNGRYRRPAFVGSLAIALAVAIPVERASFSISGTSISEFAFSVNDQLYVLLRAFSLLLFLATVSLAAGVWRDSRWERFAGVPRRVMATRINAVLVPHDGVVTRDIASAALARVMFAAVLVGNAGVILGIPITVILAFAFFPLLFRRAGALMVLSTLAGRLRDFRPELAGQILLEGGDQKAEDKPVVEEGGTIVSTVIAAPDASPVTSFAGRLKAFLRQLRAGLEPEKEAVRPSSRALALASDPIVPRLSVLSLGPSDEPWRNAAKATRLGLLLQLVPLVVYVLLFLPQTIGQQDPRLGITLAFRIVGFIADWAALAFFFGLFYEYIDEATGLRKGLRVSILILVLTLPVRLYAAWSGAVAISVIAFDAVEVVIFLGVLGLLFDLAILNVPIDNFDRVRAAIRALTSTSGLRPVALLVGAVITAGIAAAASLLTGEISNLVKSALTPLLGASGG